MCACCVQDFRKISSFLEHRSVGDCVRFFYEHQKSEEFANYRRKKQIKKRRLYSEASKRKGFMVAAAGPRTDGPVVRPRSRYLFQFFFSW